MKTTHTAALIFACIISFGAAQTGKEDSLRTALKTAKEDTNMVNSLNALSRLLSFEDKNEAALEQAEQAMAVAKKIGFNKGLATAYVNAGLAHDNLGQTTAALSNYHEGLTIRENRGDKKGMAFCKNLIGNVYNNQGKYPEAMEEFLSALKIYEEAGDKKGIVRMHNSIGNVNFYKKNYDGAIREYAIVLAEREKTGDNKGWAGALNNVGVVYEAQHKYKEALQQYEAALKIREKIHDDQGIADSRQSMGNVYTSQGLYGEAMEQYNKALEIQERIGDRNGIAFSYLNRGYLYFKLKQYARAEREYETTLQLNRELANKPLASLTYRNFTSLDSARNDYKAALIHYKYYVGYQDSIYNQQNMEKLTRAEMQYTFDKKEAMAKAEQEKKDAIAEEEKHKQRLVTTFIATGLGLVIIFALLIFRSLRITKKQKDIIEQQKDEVMQQKILVESQKQIIEEKHKEITDSINYAERIQRSFLASKSLLEENLNEYFVYFQPKDVVSGDFYWACRLSNGNFAYATADSTGHGVPGAIMSILNISSLEKSTEKETEPASILNETRKQIIERLKKDGSPEGGKDGMDCSLVVLERDAKRLSYAAANSPVWIVRGGRLLEFAPDKMPVGKHDKDQVLFTQHQIDLQPGDVVYTFTDGFADQFGGPKGKKFMYKQLKGLLLSIAHLAMREQQQKVAEALNQWKGNMEQVDDVCVVGVKV